MLNLSPFQKERYTYRPKLPLVLSQPISDISVELSSGTTGSEGNENELKALFPHSYGAPAVKIVTKKNPHSSRKRIIAVILSGGQAPGGHNVIAGIFDAMKSDNPDSILYGIEGGSSGIIDGKLKEITPRIMDNFRNTGGFDIIGSGRTKLESEEQFEKSLMTCKKYGIDSVVIIGGDDSNTNAAILAEWFQSKDCGITVVGCPKTIDGDLKNQHIETSFGFDTATKTYSELVGNIARDANSAKKYWHFIRLMGRSASHIALECALQTQPDICIISEEVQEKNLSLSDVVNQIVDVVVKRSKTGRNFGVALIPEGLIEFIPEVGTLILELDNILASNESAFPETLDAARIREWVNKRLSHNSTQVFSSLPLQIQIQLLDDRDPHGNVQVSRIETEKLLMDLVSRKLTEMQRANEYSGKFSTLSHFFGYEGRCAFPSNFDSDYCYGLGFTSFMLISFEQSGYIATMGKLHLDAACWTPGGVPLTMMMNMEVRHGESRPVIRKALVALNGKPFREFQRMRDGWVLGDSYRYPGAIQYYGSSELCDQTTLTLELENRNGG